MSGHKIRNFILDLDDTLYPYAPAHKAGMEAVVAQLQSSFDLTADEILESFNKARRQNQLALYGQAASHHRLLYFQRMFEALGMNSLILAPEYYERYWETFLDQMEISEGVYDGLERIRAKGGKVCILTDLTAHIQFRKLQRLQLTEHIDYMVTSEEVGMEKPHPYMFMRALEKLGAQAYEAVMVGDNWDKDIVGAYGQGIRGYWMNSAQELPEALPGITQVQSFKEIRL